MSGREGHSKEMSKWYSSSESSIMMTSLSSELSMTMGSSLSPVCCCSDFLAPGGKKILRCACSSGMYFITGLVRQMPGAGNPGK